MGMRWSYGLLGLLISALLAFTLTIHFLGSKTNLLGRYPGDPNNDMVREKAAFCNASEPSKWVYDECSLLIGCILNELDEIYKNDLAIGTTIIGLLPSIIGIAAAPPEEIIKLALASPLRGVATAAFSVGISPTVFTRLKPMGSGPSANTERTWIIPLARVTRQWSWAHVLVKVLADVVILALTGVMLWQNWTVNSAVLVQWLCESPLMIFTWPLVNMLWVPVALSLLYAMTESVCFKHATQDAEYCWWQVLLMPYTLDVDSLYQWDLGSKALSPSSGNNAVGRLRRSNFRLKRTSLNTGAPMNTISPAASYHGTQSINKYSIRVVAKMPNNSVVFSWEVYFFIIEICAIAIYFYATFVLLSVLFIGAVGSVRFAALMAGLYAGVRLIECLV